MTRCCSSAAAILIISLSIISYGAAKFTSPVAERPMRPDEATKLLKSILARGRGEFSSLPTSARSKFEIALLLRRKLPGGSIAGFKARIRRDKERRAVTVYTLDGLFWCYASSGLFISADSNRPGELVAVNGGDLTCVYRIVDGKSVFNLQYGKPTGAPQVLLAVNELTEALLPKIISAELNPNRDLLTCRTPNALVKVALAEVADGSIGRITGMDAVADAGLQISFSIEDLPSAPFLEPTDLGVNPIPLSEFHESLESLPRADFGSDPRERKRSLLATEAIERLRLEGIARDQGERLRRMVHVQWEHSEATARKQDLSADQLALVHALVVDRTKRIDVEFVRLLEAKEQAEEFARSALRTCNGDEDLKRILGPTTFKKFEAARQRETYDDVGMFETTVLPTLNRALLLTQTDCVQEHALDERLERFKSDYEQIIGGAAGTSDVAAIKKKISDADAEFNGDVRHILGEPGYREFLQYLRRPEALAPATQPASDRPKESDGRTSSDNVPR